MMNIVPAIETIPKRNPDIRATVHKEKETRKGKAILATITARLGSGLNLKYSVLEKGSDKEDIIP
ncbi:MAG: hypothetical protein GWN56_08075, partial [Nitrosopumilaceae archaeon]|nr:hypothetical protein [Nitrosopumilaceae archaeon]